MYISALPWVPSYHLPVLRENVKSYLQLHMSSFHLKNLKLGARFCLKHFTNVNLFNPHNNPVR